MSLKNNKMKSNLVVKKLRILLGSLIIIPIMACSAQQQLPEGPTRIPTLIPATLPASAIEPTETIQFVIESYPAGLPSASSGQGLYAEHCVNCHGADGNGVVPNARNFGDVDYMRGETPIEFYSIIAEGRGEEMPGFGDDLSSDQLWDILYFIWRFSTSDEILQEGRNIYQANCVSCHGEDGRSMILGAANFSDQRFLSHQSPSDLYVIVTQGEGSMPAWQARLSQDERWAVIDYIRTFTYDPTVSSEEVAIETEVSATPTQRPECATYISQINPYAWDDAETIHAGEALYVNCSGCHGEDGKGSIPGIIDLTDPLFQAQLQDNSGVVLCIIAEGQDAMPGWKSTFSEIQMWQVLTFISSLGNQ